MSTEETEDESECEALVRLNVRRLRLQAEWSQEELAARADVTRTYIGYLESRGRNISVRILCKLAEGLEVDPRELLRPQQEWPKEP
jgi:transcriptional regulator with XRE-family HTH domain